MFSRRKRERADRNTRVAEEEVEENVENVEFDVERGDRGVVVHHEEVQKHVHRLHFQGFRHRPEVYAMNGETGKRTGTEVVLHGFEPERDDIDVALEAIDPDEQAAHIEGGHHDWTIKRREEWYDCSGSAA